MEKIVVGMSGGVDSALCAALLKEQDYEVIGMFMKNWEEQDENGVCTSAQDAEDVRRIADTLGIDYYAVTFVKEYKDRVFSYFLEEYKKGRTPNPDVLCNKEIKFKSFLGRALQTGAAKVATGHYANVEMREGYYRLLKARDENKDQTYFLCMLNQEQLSKAMFPLGGYLKTEVRQMARERNIHVADKKDSTGVCFIGERNFKEFLQQFLPAQKGDIVTEKGEIVGRHDGLMYYTLGQRRGLGIGGYGDGRSFFVVDKDLDNNRLIVVQGDDSKLLYSRGLYAEPLHFIAETLPKSFECTAKFRYRQKEQRCFVTQNKDGCYIEFEQNQRAITPGQFAVLYIGDECVGASAIIKGEPV